MIIINKSEMLSMIDFETRGSALKSCNKEALEHILVDYYFKGKTLKKIIEDYELQENSYKVRESFPKLVNNVLCKYDRNKMSLKLPSKDGISWFPTPEDKFKCEKCGHIDEIGCMCENCKKTYRLEIEKNYVQEDKINLDTLGLEDKLLLATILQYLHVNSVDEEIGPYYNFYDRNSPDYFEKVEALNRLYKKGIISVSPYSDIAAFPMDENFPNTFYLGGVKWKINLEQTNIENEQFINLLKYPDSFIQASNEEINFVWRDIVIHELIRLFKYQVDEFRFSNVNEEEEEKLISLFIRLSKVLVPSQIYSIIWLSFRKANDRRTRNTWGNYKFHQIDFIIKIIEETAIQKSREDVPILKYEYPYQMNATLYTKIFFEQLLSEFNWFDLKIPYIYKQTSDKELENFYEKLKGREISFFDEKDIKVEYYYLTNFGVVIFDGNVEWLFSNEETLHKMSKFLKIKDNILEDNNPYCELDIPFYIKGAYSLSYLLRLIIYLRENHNYFCPKDDRKIISSIESKL